jgi:hypothetical protein
LIFLALDWLLVDFRNLTINFCGNEIGQKMKKKVSKVTRCENGNIEEWRKIEGGRRNRLTPISRGAKANREKRAMRGGERGRGGGGRFNSTRTEAEVDDRGQSSVPAFEEGEA